MSGPNAPPINPAMIQQVLQNPQAMQMLQQIAPQLMGGGGGGGPPDTGPPPPGGQTAPLPTPEPSMTPPGVGGPPGGGAPPTAMLQALQGRIQGG